VREVEEEEEEEKEEEEEVKRKRKNRRAVSPSFQLTDRHTTLTQVSAKTIFVLMDAVAWETREQTKIAFD
jgi:hypothetical protein